MPTAEVYLCDKTEGLTGEHLRCGREVPPGEGIFLNLEVMAAGQKSAVAQLRFCSRRHANYWLIRQRVARDSA